MSGAIVLIGLSGTGKSTIGRLLAAQLQLPFVDTDRAVEELAQCTIAAIFKHEGEDGFREREAAAVATACGSSAIVSVGGGAVLREQNRRTMRRANLVVWLDLPVALLAQRLSTHQRGEVRPLLGANTATRLREQSRSRRWLYAATAHLRIAQVDGTYGSNQAARALAPMCRTWLVEECYNEPI